MSETTDEERAAEREDERWRRLEKTFAELLSVARMRREGLSLTTIAARLGKSERTMHYWLTAVKVMERKGRGGPQPQ